MTQPDRPWETSEDRARIERAKGEVPFTTGCIFVVLAVFALFAIGLVMMLIG